MTRVLTLLEQHLPFVISKIVQTFVSLEDELFSICESSSVCTFPIPFAIYCHIPSHCSKTIAVNFFQIDDTLRMLVSSPLGTMAIFTLKREFFKSELLAAFKTS